MAALITVCDIYYSYSKIARSFSCKNILFMNASVISSARISPVSLGLRPMKLGAEDLGRKLKLSIIIKCLCLYNNLLHPIMSL
jgi:hypothetical protein